MFGVLKRVFVGRPLASTQMEEQRLTKTIALAVFSSDALSSTAYATEEILFVVAVGASSLALGLSKLVPIAIVVAGLLAIVIVSYRQVIFAYPNGGGAYVVSKENIGEMASLVAAASLMVDYVLTVAVSISAGVAAIISIPEFSSLAQHRVELGVGLIVLITLLNMRGIKESGRIFAIPTYLYMLVFGALIVYGLFRSFTGDISTIPYNAELAETSRELGGTLTLFLLLKGFSSGAVALTGIEAISNGVPAFRRPESKNAAATLVWMGVLLGTMFFGISILAHRLQPYPSHDRTVIAQIGLQVFGNGALFVFLQFATAAILVLAANTAYNGFPSLSSIIAFDGYLPQQLMNRGDRLVFSNGIIMLAGAAALLLVAFGGITNALIPLYAVGVFTSFTLSQSGMVRHHLKLRQPHWRRSTVLNAVGARRHARRAAHRRHHEVHERRMGTDRRHPGHRGALQGDQAPLHEHRRASAGPAGLQAAAQAAHGGRARRRHQRRRARSARLRHVDRARPSPRGDGGVRRFRGRDLREEVVGVRDHRAARGRADTDGGVHRRDAVVHRRGRNAAGRTTSSTCSSPSSTCSIGGGTCCTTRAR